MFLVLIISPQFQQYIQRPELRQHIFELNFQVDNLRATISKSTPEGVEKPLGDVSFERFALVFALAQYDMKVDINLRYVFILMWLSLLLILHIVDHWL